MRIAVDTNVLLRLLLGDDDSQGAAAIEAMERASLVAISVHALCELAWVLDRQYGMPRAEIAASIRGLIGSENVVVNRPMVDAGLAMLDLGGGFADGVVAFDGRWLGGEIFVSFDKRAVQFVERQGASTRLLT